MKRLIGRALLGIAIFGGALQAAALDLPVKRIDGKDMYYYAVRRGDTVYGITRALGISRDDIVRHNQSAADGLRQGQTLYFPVSEYGSPEAKALATATPGGPTFKYKVQRGETLFGLSHRFGVTPEQIVALNPQSNDGIRAGEYLIIPGSCDEGDGSPATAPTATQSAPSAAAADEAPATPATAPIQAAQTVADAMPEPDVPDEAAAIESYVPTGSVAVLLPLMLDEAEPSKTALRASDFVKGLMLAAREAGADGSPVRVSVHDTKGSPAEIARLMADSAIADADIIIAPDDEAGMAAVVRGASADAYVFNILAVQDSLYLTHDNVIQANIPHSAMYETALRGLMESYEGYTPVFLVCKGGRSDKHAFTQYARSEYARRGVEPIEMIFEGTLQGRDLEALDPSGRYVFIPASGSLGEFNKFARALKTLRESSADPASIALFGYPEWIIFRSEAEELLHSLGATFYSRFFADERSSAVSAFRRSFTTTFGSEPMDVVPSQAMLGYDTARYIFADIRENSGVYSPQTPAEYTGLQSAFRLRGAHPGAEGEPAADDADDGVINTALYLITYLPGNGVATRIL